MVVKARVAGDEMTFLLGSREIAGSAKIDVYSPTSPLGSAIKGSKVGDEVSYKTPSGGTIESRSSPPGPSSLNRPRRRRTGSSGRCTQSWATTAPSSTYGAVSHPRDGVERGVHTGRGRARGRSTPGHRFESWTFTLRCQSSQYGSTKRSQRASPAASCAGGRSSHLSRRADARRFCR